MTETQKEYQVKKTLAHTVWECKYHVVWVPKNRRKVVYGKLKRDIGKIIRRLCEYKQIEVVEGTACADHIHMCLSIPLASTNKKYVSISRINRRKMLLRINMILTL